MKSKRRLLPATRGAAAETQAVHELMELVRNNPEANRLVFQLREAGRSWPDVLKVVRRRARAVDPSGQV